MNDISKSARSPRAATIIIIAGLLFYLPSMITIFNPTREPRSLMWNGLTMATLYTLTFCLNYFWLVPATLIRNDRKALYIIINTVLIVAFCSIVPLWLQAHGGLPRPGPHAPRNLDTSLAEYMMGYVRFVIRDSVMMILSAGLALALRLNTEREKMRRRMLELNSEKKQIELMNLKAQLNPHFLFNTLNNIYALIGFAPDRAQKALHELSGMLRFMIYDSTSDLVPLSRELKFIEEYVELMKLRLSNSTSLRCDITSDSGSDLFVAPLLFLTLVENAFKHFGRNSGECFIAIHIFQDYDPAISKDVLFCRVENSYGEKSAARSDQEVHKSGVGLSNVKRQLEMLYNQKHLFTISDNKEKGIFTAEIRLPIYVLHTQPTAAKEKKMME